MLLTLLALGATAQAQDFLTVWGGYALPSTLENTILDDPADVRFGSFGASVLTPPIRFFDDRLLWLNGASFSQTRPGFSIDLPDDTSNTMTSVTLDLVFLASLSERWNGLVMLSPGLQSNFAEPLSVRDFRMQGVGVVTYDVSEATTLGLGAGYANLFGLPRPFPVIQASIDGGWWELDVLLPQKVELWASLLDPLRLGVSASLQGGYFHRGSDRANAPDDVFIRNSIGAVGPAAQLALGPLKLKGEFGWSFFRRYEIFQGDESFGDFDLDDNFAGRLTLSFSPR